MVVIFVIGVGMTCGIGDGTVNVGAEGVQAFEFGCYLGGGVVWVGCFDPFAEVGDEIDVGCCFEWY